MKFVNVKKGSKALDFPEESVAKEVVPEFNAAYRW